MWAAICFTGAGAEMTPVKISMPTDDRSKLGRELVNTVPMTMKFAQLMFMHAFC